jgi:uncharacterized membrane protein
VHVGVMISSHRGVCVFMLLLLFLLLCELSTLYVCDWKSEVIVGMNLMPNQVISDKARFLH